MAAGAELFMPLFSGFLSFTGTVTSTATDPDFGEHARTCLNVSIVRGLSSRKRAQVPLLGLDERNRRYRPSDSNTEGV